MALILTVFVPDRKGDVFGDTIFNVGLHLGEKTQFLAKN